MPEDWVERFNEGCMNFIERYFMIGFIVLLVGIVGIGVVAGFSHKTFACSHPPHLGACRVPVESYYWNAATKTMTPSSSPCGCISDHGVIVLPAPAK